MDWLIEPSIQNHGDEDTFLGNAGLDASQSDIEERENGIHSTSIYGWLIQWFILNDTYHKASISICIIMVITDTYIVRQENKAKKDMYFIANTKRKKLRSVDSTIVLRFIHFVYLPAYLPTRISNVRALM